MAKNLDDILAALPKARLQRIDARAIELATLKALRQAAQQTQEQLAVTLGVRQIRFPGSRSLATCCSLPCDTTLKAWGGEA